MFGTNDRSPASAMVTRIVEQVVPTVVDSIDVDAVVQRVDVDALIQRVDIDALLQRVDVDGLVARIDLKALLDRIDVASIAERAEIGELVAQSTSHVAGSTLDLARRQLVGLDLVVIRLVNRLFRRDLTKLKLGPDLLVGPAESAEAAP